MYIYCTCDLVSSCATSEFLKWSSYQAKNPETHRSAPPRPVDCRMAGRSRRWRCACVAAPGHLPWTSAEFGGRGMSRSLGMQVCGKITKLIMYKYIYIYMQSCNHLCIYVFMKKTYKYIHTYYMYIMTKHIYTYMNIHICLMIRECIDGCFRHG